MNSGQIEAGVHRWKSAGSGPAGRAAVIKWLNRQFPSMGSQARDAALRAIRDAVDLGNQFERNNPGYKPGSGQYYDPTRRQRERGQSGNRRYFYVVDYHLEYTDDEGNTTSTFRRETVTSDRPMSRQELTDEATSHFGEYLKRITSRRGGSPLLRNRFSELIDVRIVAAWSQIG